MSERMTADEQAITAFLNRAQQRIAEHPGRIPFDTRTGNFVLNWLRGRLGVEMTERTSP